MCLNLTKALHETETLFAAYNPGIPDYSLSAAGGNRWSCSTLLHTLLGVNQDVRRIKGWLQRINKYRYSILKKQKRKNTIFEKVHTNGLNSSEFGHLLQKLQGRFTISHLKSTTLSKKKALDRPKTFRTCKLSSGVLQVVKYFWAVCFCFFLGEKFHVRFKSCQDHFFNAKNIIETYSVKFFTCLQLRICLTMFKL